MLLTGLRIATMSGPNYGLIDDGAILMDGGNIAGIFENPAQIPESPENIRKCRGRLATPGLIDCHTHLVYGGSRADEFEKRLNGVPYAEIAQAGGGILSTVRMTRTSTEASLAQSALKRLDVLLAEGVTTVEIKSGYGLDTATEMKTLRVARGLAAQRPVDIVTSFLGAHA